MADYVTSIAGMPVTNARVEGLMADFSGLANLEKTVSDVLRRLALQENAQKNAALVKSGSMSLGDFDGWFAEIVRAELGKTLGIVRSKAVEKALRSGAGSASSAILRRTYKDRFGGNINILNNRKRISSRKRVVEPPTGGRSGIRRVRTVKARTKKIREYFGPDRGFILRILNNGRGEYIATGDGPVGRGSKATYGRRGSISGGNFFDAMSSDMEQSAQQLGKTLIGHVNKWLDNKFKEEKTK